MLSCSYHVPCIICTLARSSKTQHNRTIGNTKMFNDKYAERTIWAHLLSSRQVLLCRISKVLADFDQTHCASSSCNVLTWSVSIIRESSTSRHDLSVGVSLAARFTMFSYICWRLCDCNCTSVVSSACESDQVQRLDILQGQCTVP